MSRLSLITAALAAASLMAGCDLLGDSPEKIAAAREADGRAIGGACRHAGRAIEDCYALNKKADRAAVFAGWRDMNDYMRENKIESVAPVVTAPVGRKADDREGSHGGSPAAGSGGRDEDGVQVERKPAKATAKPADEEPAH